MGDREQIATGSFQTLGMDTDTKVRLKWAGDEVLVIFAFSEDHTHPGVATKGEALDNNQTLRITFINFNSSMPIFPIKPMRIGTVADREVFLAYRIERIPGTTRHFTAYSFLAAQEVAHG